MSEQDSTIRPEDEDVEAHKSKRLASANEEPTDAESESDDDVELHGGTKSKRLAS